MRSSLVSLLFNLLGSIIFIEHFLWHLITVNHNRTHFHLCPIGSQHVMSNGHTSIHEPWYWLVWAIDSSQPTRVVWRLDQMSSHVVTFWVLSFGILDKSVWRRASLTLVSLLLYNKQVSCSNLQKIEPWSNSVSLRCAKASRWSASISWKGLPSLFWLRVII